LKIKLAAMNKVLTEANKRIISIDATRGLVMIIMALDHVRDFMHVSSITQDPTNLQTTTAALFLTRWITHLCAPTFVFLSGVSAYVSQKKFSQKFLLSRGLWLILIDFTVINFALWFDIYFRTLIVEVVCAIGAGLVVLSLLIKLPSRIIGLIGILIIFGHNLFQNVSFKENPALNFIFSLLFRQSLFQVNPSFDFITGYPLVPWIGIVLAGFGFGELFNQPVEIRKKRFLQIGIVAFTLFLVLRLINIYGDPSVWSVQKSSIYTLLSFINVTKYPPSLLFTLLMLSITLLVLWITDGIKNKFTDILSVYGKVPLFYFIIHLYLIHLIMLAMVFYEGFGFKDLKFGILSTGRPQGSGVELWVIYLTWIGVVLLLFPLCKWYGRYKANHKDNQMLRYL
jgi:uncharacterized membrane protein